MLATERVCSLEGGSVRFGGTNLLFISALITHIHNRYKNDSGKNVRYKMSYIYCQNLDEL
jgi:hypothetical protein